MQRTLVAVPRSARQVVPAGYYHITNHANGRDLSFVDDNDRTWFLTLLTRQVKAEVWTCLAYCLMSNHYHLVLRVPTDSMSRGMHRLNGLYAQAFNKRHGRRGHVFANRYKLTYIETEEHLLEACRYVVMNPVRAGLCDHPRDWPWSSYRVSAGLERTPDCVDLPAVYALFGSPDGYVAGVSTLDAKAGA